ncbi:hypothetical protein D1007_40197 [Hordeum vulgare]|nr:hypothetical protein D1007_40197 [Hordeum vulgare]
MKGHFDLHNKSGIDRTERSLPSEWSTINRDCRSSLLHKTYFKERKRRPRKGKMKKGRPFTLPHCYDELKDDEKWKSHEGVNEETNKHKRTIDLQERHKEKKKRKRDDELTIAMEAIVNTRKDANEVRKMTRNQEAAAEKRRLAAEERRVAVEERKVTLEEKKLAMEERTRLLEWEKNLIFMDTSTLDEKQKETVVS